MKSRELICSNVLVPVETMEEGQWVSALRKVLEKQASEDDSPRSSILVGGTGCTCIKSGFNTTNAQPWLYFVRHPDPSLLGCAVWGQTQW